MWVRMIYEGDVEELWETLLKQSSTKQGLQHYYDDDDAASSSTGNTKRGRQHYYDNVIYALWKVPDILPSFMLKGGEVSRYVIGGADLMFPGISIAAEGLPSFIAWAVKVPGNPAPIAVGTTTMSCTEALKAGLRGKALKIAHYYGDLLWESVEGPYVPNAGF
ncbi:putative PUA domain-containing protein [Rosa chinensis]|uniref:Putative PUA domain-containing protein n=1 Tax=Rosa chinensis TaxID=74649 RepID=A0A2P6PKF5_ROSCH|nr:putative PUA domain-containing protein [Rosa chinensis]